MARVLSFFSTVLLASALHAQQERLSIHFATSSATLDAQAQATLSGLCEQAGDRPVRAIGLTGHTDDTGPAAYNAELSARRVQAVRGYLQSHCPTLAALEMENYQVDASACSNTGITGRAADRRVDLLVLHAPPPETSAKTSALPYPVALHEHPKVQQLLPGADKPRELYTVDGGSAIDITAADGTAIHIDAGSLLDPDGRPVTGPVDLTYRSFSEPYEIIASGIPMHVKDHGSEAHMETAGMYEIYASQGERSVRLKPGARIQLQRPEAEPLDPTYTSWVLNDSTGEWDASGTVAVGVAGQVTEASGPRTTAAVATYWQEMDRLKREPCPDTVHFDARRASDQYCHLTSCGAYETYSSKWKRRRHQYDGLAGVPNIQVIGFKGIYDPDNVVFTLTFDEDDQFPAWRRLPGEVVWSYTGGESRALFKRLYARHHTYQDVDLVMAPGTTEGVLRLKEDGQWLELSVDADLNCRTKEHRERWDSRLRQYARSEAKQRMLFDRNVERSKKRYLHAHRNEEVSAWTKARRDMDDTEKAIAQTDWRAYAEPRRPFSPVASLTSETQVALASVRSTFDLDGFGICNLDRLMESGAMRNVMASAVDENGEPFRWAAAYGVVGGRRAVITYWGNNSGKDDLMMVFKGGMRSMFLVDAAGNVASASVGPLNTGGPNVVLKVKHLDKGIDLDTMRTTAGR